MRRLGYKFASAKPQCQFSDGYTIYYMMRGLERGWYTTLNHANIRLFFEIHIFFNYKVGSGQTFSWKKNIFQATETEWRKFLKSMLFYTGHRYRVQTTKMPITPFVAFPFFLKGKDTNTEWSESTTPSSNVSIGSLFKVGSINSFQWKVGILFRLDVFTLLKP